MMIEAFWDSSPWTCAHHPALTNCPFASLCIHSTTSHMASVHGIHVTLATTKPFIKPLLSALLTTQPLSEEELTEKIGCQQLMQIMSIQKHEIMLESSSQSKTCCFCTHVFPSCDSLFGHLSEGHGFFPGKRANIVFLDEMLETIRMQVSSGTPQCLLCDRVFKDPQTLRLHMRKKKHFQINPRNSAYDRFYLSNYSKFLKKNNDVDSDDDNEGEDRNDAQQQDFEEWNDRIIEETKCLFCNHISQDSDACAAHMQSIHQFDLLEAARKNDFYSQIRLINYIRTMVAESKCFFCLESFPPGNDDLCLETHLRESGHQSSNIAVLPDSHHVWKDPSYLFPFFENDPLLSLDNPALYDDDEDDNNGGHLDINNAPCMQQRLPLKTDCFQEKDLSFHQHHTEQ